MSSQHLFSWIRAAKEGRLALPADEVAVFVPIVTAATEVTKARRDDRHLALNGKALRTIPVDARRGAP